MNDVYLDLGSELAEEIEKITDVNYSSGGLVSMGDIVDMIKDLVVEYNDLKEELEDTIEDRNENYTKIDEPCWEDITRERGY